MSYNNWANKDDQFLINNINLMKNREISDILGRSQKSVESRISKLKINRTNYNYTKEDDDFIINNVDAMTNRELGLKLNRSQKSIGSRIVKLKIKRKNLPKKWTKKEDEFLINNIEKMNNKKISTQINRTEASIANRIKKLKIKREIYKHNFKKYTEINKIYEKDDILGYICGIMASDGNISSSSSKIITLSLHYKDKEVVQFVIDNLIEEKYKLKPANNGKQYRFCLSTPIFVNYLQSIGITNRKSKTLDVKIEEHSDIFKLYFLRGVIDGDGTIRLTKETSSCNIAIVSASYNFLLTIQKYFGGKIYKRKTGYYDIIWGGYRSRDLAKILPIDDFTMERKTKLINELKNIEFFCEKNPYGHGVQKRKNRFVSRIQYNKKRINIGSFKTLEDAQAAYNKKAIELFGEDAKINIVCPSKIKSEKYGT